MCGGICAVKSVRVVKHLSQIMEFTAAYRWWQAPFVQAKLAPVLRHNDLSHAQRVLDVGCGPGTNCGFFGHADYLGLDINPRYIDYARDRYGRRFDVADIRTYETPADERFDFVLMNSLLHHIDEANVRRMLLQLRGVLADGGHVHIIDLVLPNRKGIPRTLAQCDRGDFARPLEAWEEIFGEFYESVVLEPFDVRLGGIRLWNLVYFKGKARS